MADNYEKETGSRNPGIHGNLYESYRFEIENVWRRQTMLTAFAGMFFVGYGILVLRMVDNYGIAGKIPQTIIFNELVCGLSLLAIVFSTLWITMAKGSKGWQEVYEMKIKKYEKESTSGDDHPYRLGENTKGKDFNDSLLSTAAGRYSVSRINIVIGIVQLVVWTLILLSHLMLFPVIVCDAGESVFFWLNTVVLYLLIAILAVASVKLSMRSTALGKPYKKRKKKKVENNDGKKND